MFGCVEGFYPDSVAKVGLAVAVGQSAKTHLVKELGVGEEIAMTVIGWSGDRLECVAQIDRDWGDPTDEDERTARVAMATTVMKRGWGVDSFTMLAEGWVSTNPNKTRDKDLVDEFAKGDEDVRECLSVCHVEEEEVHICALPFTMKLGKKVQWGKLLHTESSDMMRNAALVEVMERSLEVPMARIPEEVDTFRLALAMGLADEAGFFLQYEF